MNSKNSLFLCLLFLLNSVMTGITQQTLPEIVVGLEIDASNFPSDNTELRNTFYSRVMNGLAMNGIGSNGLSAISVLAQINEGEAIYTATAPVRVVQTFTFQLRIQNTLSGEVFSSYSEEVKIIRKSQTETYKKAILELDLSSRAFQSFIKTTKQKIHEYYISNCTAILTHAERLFAQRAHLHAIAKLQSIPVEASNCSEKVTQMIEQAYTEYLEIACTDHMSKAKALIANRQFDQGVLALMGIPPGAVCQDEMSAAIKELKDHQIELDEMNWNRLVKLHEIELERTDRQYRFLELIAYLNSRSNQYIITAQNTIIPITE